MADEEAEEERDRCAAARRARRAAASCAYCERHREAILEQHRRWQEEHRGRVAERRRARAAGRPRTTTPCADCGAALAEASGDRWALAYAQSVLGSVALVRRDHDLASTARGNAGWCVPHTNGYAKPPTSSPVLPGLWPVLPDAVRRADRVRFQPTLTLPAHRNFAASVKAQTACGRWPSLVLDPAWREVAPAIPLEAAQKLCPRCAARLRAIRERDRLVTPDVNQARLF